MNDYRDALLLGLMATRWGRFLLAALLFPGALGAALMGYSTDEE